MKIIKEPGRIILELNEEEDKIIDYFILSRGPDVLNEYFGHFMDGRKGTREAEIKQELWEKYKDGELD
jgi:hypothetical protein